ncbi:MAG TPA: DUF4252 domain-containing protein [Lacipirellulaceae bacterium]|nr:DUF4252 domain-containing protein [Lacipirellulaceae bacterium]
MSRTSYFISRGFTTIFAATTLCCCAILYAEPAESSKPEEVGRINFSEADLPPANVELDLSQGMFGDLFGIGDAAIAGVAEALAKSSTGESSEGTRMAADKLAAARQIIELANKVVREVRVRAYEKSPGDLSSHFDSQLKSGNWEQILLVRKGDENARVSVIRRDNSIRGIFVVAGGHGGAALVNIVCDLSPQNVKELTSAATKIGLDNGLRQAIEMKMRGMHGRMVAPPRPPLPPKPPRAPVKPQHEAA